MTLSRAPIRPDRVRKTAGRSFAFLPHRFLRDGFLISLRRDELALYMFLVLAADRNGISFYGYDAISTALEMTLDEYIAARNVLIHKDLLAFDGRRFQVLSLPERPIFPEAPALSTEEELDAKDPASIRRTCLRALRRDEEK